MPLKGNQTIWLVWWVVEEEETRKDQQACRKQANAAARKADLGASIGAADIRTVPKLANLHQKPKLRGGAAEQAFNQKEQRAPVKNLEKRKEKREEGELRRRSSLSGPGFKKIARFLRSSLSKVDIDSERFLAGPTKRPIAYACISVRVYSYKAWAMFFFLLRIALDFTPSFSFSWAHERVHQIPK